VTVTVLVTIWKVCLTVTVATTVTLLSNNPEFSRATQHLFPKEEKITTTTMTYPYEQMFASPGSKFSASPRGATMVSPEAFLNLPRNACESGLFIIFH
jgi:hypothetical protein